MRYPIIDFCINDEEPAAQAGSMTVVFDSFEPSIRSYVWWDDDGEHQFLRTWVHYPNKSSVSISRGEPCEEFERQFR